MAYTPITYTPITDENWEKFYGERGEGVLKLHTADKKRWAENAAAATAKAAVVFAPGAASGAAASQPAPSAPGAGGR